MAKQTLPAHVETEIQRLVSKYKYDKKVLQHFARFVLAKEPTDKTKESSDKKPKPKTKQLTLPQLKNVIYEHFQVKDTVALKKSGSFQMATSSLDKLDLSKKEGWEILYRKLIGVLPGEDNEQGYGCVNGINIFKYDLPWRALGLDPQTAQTQDIKSAYRELSKVYHPDNRETGDSQIFDRLTVFYRSLSKSF